MKKLLLILLCLPFIGFGQDCVRGNCENGIGEYSWGGGEKYLGEWRGGVQHGEGTYTYESGANYVGEWKSGFKHGQGTYTYASGANYVGEWKFGFKHGQGTFTYASGANYVGEHKDGKRHGLGTYTSSDGVEEDLLEWEDGKRIPNSGKGNRIVKNGEWAGNGSGIIISKSGYIITNHHVIDDADDIEVEFILDDEVKKFNAEIIQSDKVNDLAVIKIEDVNFNGVEELPYNFKIRSSDVGTKVYAYGYPMALSIMGKEIKVTDGIISSKTGYDGNITTYQISAPIQGGNSGGPLFDDKGNFIAINSAKLKSEIADNVGYSIKSSYVFNLIDILPKTIDLPSNKKLASLPLTEQIKEITKYVVLIKVK
jgi:V8-like Glu-specific endopeptidase